MAVSTRQRSLLNVPVEVVINVIGQLDCHDVARLSRTCYYLRDLSETKLYSDVSCVDLRSFGNYLKVLNQYPERSKQLKQIQMNGIIGKLELQQLPQGIIGKPQPLLELLQLPLPKLRSLWLGGNHPRYNDAELSLTIISKILQLPSLQSFNYKPVHDTSRLSPTHMLEQIVRHTKLKYVGFRSAVFDINGARECEMQCPSLKENKNLGPLEIELIQCSFGVSELEYFLEIAPGITSVTIFHTECDPLGNENRNEFDSHKYLEALLPISQSLESLKIADAGRFNPPGLDLSPFVALRRLRVEFSWLFVARWDKEFEFVLKRLPSSLEDISIDSWFEGFACGDFDGIGTPRRDVAFCERLLAEKTNRLPNLKRVRFYYHHEVDLLGIKSFLPELQEVSDLFGIEFHTTSGTMNQWDPDVVPGTYF